LYRLYVMDQIFSSTYFTSFQSSSNSSFYIDFGHKTIEMSFCQLLSLRHKAKQLSSNEHIEYMLAYQDVTLLTFCDREHIVLLDTLQLLDFVALIQGTFAMIELHDLLAI